MKKNKIIVLILAIGIILAALFLFSPKDTIEKVSKNSELEKLEALKAEDLELSEFVDDVIKSIERVSNDKERVESYATLGLAYKTLADRAQDDKYYKKALDVYVEAIDLTERKNTLFLINAGNMSIYLKDYEKAEDYLKEAITVAPGDMEPYVKLGELYRYKMNKTVDEVAAVYDEGSKKMLSPAPLILKKISYYKEIDQYKKALAAYKDFVKDNEELQEKYKTQMEELEKKVN